MNKEQMTRSIKQGLLAFVLITIGFTIGKEVTIRRLETRHDTSFMADVEGTDCVVVSYVHATIKCVTCNTIERLIQETLAEQFVDVVAQGSVVFQEVNFQENTRFAKQYDIAANCVVLHRIIHGKEIEHQRLDKVWELYEDPPAFKAYLSDAVRTHLETLRKEKA